MNTVNHLWLQRGHVLPADELELNSHHWQFLQLDQGQAYWLEPARALKVGQGEVLVLLPHHRGSLRASQLSGVDFHTFCFCPELLTGLLTLADRHALETSLSGGQSPPRLLPASHPLARRFAKVARVRREENHLRLRCQLLALAVAVILAQITRPGFRTQSRPGPAAMTRFRALVSQMTDSEWNCYTACELARMCGCSQRHFGALFRNYFGVHLRIRRRDGKLTLPFHCSSCPSEAAEHSLAPCARRPWPEEIVAEK